VLAQEAARTHKHDFIGTEHILLGLLGEPRGLAYEVLVAKTESEQHIRDAIEEAMPPAGTKALRGHIAFRPESKEAIEQARRAATDLGHDWSAPNTRCWALIRAEESPAAQILRNPRLHVGRAARDGQDRDHQTARRARQVGTKRSAAGLPLAGGARTMGPRDGQAACGTRSWLLGR